jgi:hypothetical protein
MSFGSGTSRVLSGIAAHLAAAFIHGCRVLLSYESGAGEQSAEGMFVPGKEKVAGG